MDMDMERMDILGELMSKGDGAGDSFVAKCYLYLSPEELKACRLVSRTWNEFIQEYLWKDTWGKAQLRKKLVARWEKAEPVTVELSRVKQKVASMFSTDSHVFCGFHWKPHVAVYNFDGLLVKELTPSIVSHSGYLPTKLGGGDGIVAAVMWDSVLTIWSSQPDKMEQLHCFDARNFQCPTCQETGHWAQKITVVNRNKVAFLARHVTRSDALVLGVLEKVGSSWVDKTLSCFLCDGGCCLASSNSQWLAVVTGSRSSSKKLRLWDGNNSLPEVFLPGSDGHWLEDISMEFPHIVATFNAGLDQLIKVFNVGGSEPGLVKTISIKTGVWGNIFENKLFIGFKFFQSDHAHQVLLFEKNRLISPQETTGRRINIVNKYRVLTATNTTSIVIVRQVEETDEQGNKLGDLLVKKEFWMTNNIMQT